MVVMFLFLKTILKTYFENNESIILILSENYSSYMNLIFFVFIITKKKAMNKTCFMCFHYFSYFLK